MLGGADGYVITTATYGADGCERSEERRQNVHGADERDRTPDRHFTKVLLYQLSYIGPLKTSAILYQIRECASI